MHSNLRVLVVIFTNLDHRVDLVERMSLCSSSIVDISHLTMGMHDIFWNKFSIDLPSQHGHSKFQIVLIVI